MSRLFVVVLLAAALAGCSVPDASAPPSAASAPATATDAAGPQPRPVRVLVPGRGIDGEVMVDGLGLDERGGHLEPPVESPLLASWYNLGPRPGARGPAVVLGHVNGSGKDGIFVNLTKVKVGDRVVVRREDSSEVAFEVYRAESFKKSTFPTSDVYGNTAVSEIRLITCGGEYDSANRRYLSNIIVFARQVLA